MVNFIKNHIRTAVQLGFTAVTNSNFVGFFNGKIYTGSLKYACLPGLNCYSCPGAVGSCPIGAFQAVINSRSYDFSFYIVGMFLVFGAFLGRLICGWLCPFGLVQDLLHKIPFPKKLRKLPLDKYLKFLKYLIFLVFVLILPMFVLDIVGQGSPWFCSYICPSGTLFGGIPLISTNPILQQTLGFLFAWKVTILVVICLLSVIVYRPFCRYLCPLGAVYGLFNPIAMFRFSVDKNKCTNCSACQKTCPMDIPVNKSPNSFECIRCMKCKNACKFSAIQTNCPTKNKPIKQTP